MKHALFIEWYLQKVYEMPTHNHFQFDDLPKNYYSGWNSDNSSILQIAILNI